MDIDLLRRIFLNIMTLGLSTGKFDKLKILLISFGFEKKFIVTLTQF